ncbi:MAG: hypothetical protein GQ574_03695 [Crocinitomix sp.]|nr:hypothetical protein [Crocinitomix sp.]
MKGFLVVCATIVNILALIGIVAFLAEAFDDWDRGHIAPSMKDAVLLPLSIIWCFTFYILFKASSDEKKSEES